MKNTTTLDPFQTFSKIVHDTINEMTKFKVFEVGLSAEEMQHAYIGAFPDGTDPIYKTETTHTCNCCFNFIRDVGGMVAISSDGKGLKTIWDDAAIDAPYPYSVVAFAMQDLVNSQHIAKIFKHSEYETTFKDGKHIVGTQSNIKLLDDGDTVKFNHFYCELPSRALSMSPGGDIGNAASVIGVFQRGLEEFSIEHLETVSDLINNNSIYRGAEFKQPVMYFLGLKKKYEKLGDNAKWKNHFLFENYTAPAAQLRNTVIGSLLIDLSNDIPVDRAVASFENKVAPSNYKRTSAVITPKMVENALETIEELCLANALDRRHATPNDVNVNDVLFADRSTIPVMQGSDSLKDTLLKEAAKSASSSKKINKKAVLDVSVDDFMADVLPKAIGVSVLFENRHTANLFNVTTVVDESAQPLFKWDNSFSWAYNGDVTDSIIKQRVKSAGGDVSGLVRTSLSWFNHDDLDIHVKEPNGEHIYFGNRSTRYGQLDVDMNVAYPLSNTPVENITWAHTLQTGRHSVWVHNYSKRHSIDVGFVIEMESPNLGIQTFSYNKAVRACEKINVLSFVWTGAQVEDVQVAKGIETDAVSKEIWNLTTEEWQPVELICLSPNYWNGREQGNKHWFFALKDCKNPEKVRGVYNEYLRNELTQHRKVFETIGAKMMCPVEDQQLAGIGFSSTIANNVTVKVETNDSSIRTYNVKFGA